MRVTINSEEVVMRYDTDRCDTCGELIFYDFWGHVIACARNKQQRESAKRAVENGKRLVRELTKTQGVE